MVVATSVVIFFTVLTFGHTRPAFTPEALFTGPAAFSACPEALPRRPSSRIYFPGEEVPSPEPPAKSIEEETTSIPTSQDNGASRGPSHTVDTTSHPAKGGDVSIENTTSIQEVAEGTEVRYRSDEDRVLPSDEKNQEIIDSEPSTRRPITSHPPSIISSSTSSSAIHFENHPLWPKPVSIPACGGEPYFAYNNRTGDCQKLWTMDNCSEDYWFVLSRRTHEGRCLPRPCAKAQVFVKGRCYPVDEASALCPEGMAIFVDEYGDGFCDCSARQAYWPEHGRCYHVYRRGPCSEGEYLVVPKGVNAAVCVPTPCQDGDAPWIEEERIISDSSPTSVQETTGNLHFGVARTAADNCYPLKDADNTPCPLGRLQVNVFSLQLECKRLGLQAIFDPPKVRCAPGSHLDFNGNCREELFQKFRTRFLITGHNTGKDTGPSDSVCPQGFRNTPDGKCVNTALSVGGLG